MNGITVSIPSDSDPLVERAGEILKDRIHQRCATGAADGEARVPVALAIEDELAPDAFRIDQVGASIRIAGGSARGVLYGVGKFLRTSRYDGTFQPSPWRGTSVPQGSLRGMYFASHFHNWYHVAPEEELRRYVEDLALWGVNALMIAFPFLNLTGWDDPQTDAAVEMVRKYIRTAHELGLAVCCGAGNHLFSGAPREIRATPLPDPLHRRGNSGYPVCPSNPEGMDYILSNARELFLRLSDVGLDLLCFWPYDEGGCACEQCSPWGSNGHLRVSREIAKIAREYFPNLKTILSTWMFDTPPEGEWEGLNDAIRRGECDWLDYILADAHEDFPRYPLDVGVPGNRPLINFPEISMWGNWPWGGFGANPLPRRFQRLWDQVKHKVEGGFPYSEGIYEDMNKAIVSQFYWSRDRSARETLEEYIAYEYGIPDTADVLTIVDILETASSRLYTQQTVDAEQAQRAHELAESIHKRLPLWARQSWRWEILRLRALLDRERFAGDGLETPAAEAALVRLIDLYHSQMETDDPYHHRVRPPLRRAVSRRGEC